MPVMHGKVQRSKEDREDKFLIFYECHLYCRYTTTVKDSRHASSHFGAAIRSSRWEFLAEIQASFFLVNRFKKWVSQI